MFADGACSDHCSGVDLIGSGDSAQEATDVPHGCISLGAAGTLGAGGHLNILDLATKVVDLERQPQRDADDDGHPDAEPLQEQDLTGTRPCVLRLSGS